MQSWRRSMQDPATGMLPPLTPRARSPRSARSSVRPLWKDNRCVYSHVIGLPVLALRLVTFHAQLATSTPSEQPASDGTAAIGRLRHGLCDDRQLSRRNEIDQ